jgi:peptide/nickel transport system permease protein
MTSPLPAEPAAPDDAPIAGPAAASPGRLVLRRLRHDRVAVASVVVIVAVCLLAVLAPVIAHLVGHGPNEQNLETGLTPDGLPKPPSWQYLFGTDDVGRDILVRVAYGARISLLVGVVATGAAMAAGIVIGLLAGYYGGTVDAVLARFMDVVLSLPYLVFALALISIVGPSLWVSIAVIAFFSWAVVGRVVRGQTLAIKEREFVEAARSLGARDVRIMFSEILPNVVGPVIVYATLLIPSAIVFEATLSFLGLGITPPTASWGNMLSDSLNYFEVAWWFVAFPGGALLLTTLAFNLLGDALRDALAAGAEAR